MSNRYFMSNGTKMTSCRRADYQLWISPEAKKEWKIQWHVVYGKAGNNTSCIKSTTPHRFTTIVTDTLNNRRGKKNRSPKEKDYTEINRARKKIYQTSVIPQKRFIVYDNYTGKQIWRLKSQEILKERSYQKNHAVYMHDKSMITANNQWKWR